MKTVLILQAAVPDLGFPPEQEKDATAKSASTSTGTSFGSLGTILTPKEKRKVSENVPADKSVVSPALSSDSDIISPPPLDDSTKDKNYKPPKRSPQGDVSDTDSSAEKASRQKKRKKFSKKRSTPRRSFSTASEVDKVRLYIQSIILFDLIKVLVRKVSFSTKHKSTKSYAI